MIMAEGLKCPSQYLAIVCVLAFYEMAGIYWLIESASKEQHG
jgi:hypothetical protein